MVPLGRRHEQAMKLAAGLDRRRSLYDRWRENAHGIDLAPKPQHLSKAKLVVRSRESAPARKSTSAQIFAISLAGSASGDSSRTVIGANRFARSLRPFNDNAVSVIPVG